MQNPDHPKQPDYQRMFFVWALTILLFWAYLYALWHIPRAEHWSFFMETLNCQGWLENWSQSWSLDRTREIGDPNPRLFRPLFYGILSLEKVLFEHHVQYYQYLNLAFHFLICWFVYSLLNNPLFLSVPSNPTRAQRIWRGAICCLVPLFFSVNLNSAELVTGSYGAGHLLFIVLVLRALVLLCNNATLHTGRALGYLFAASLMAEYGQCYAIIFGVLTAALQRRRKREASVWWMIPLFLSVVLVFQLSSRNDAIEKGLAGQNDLKKVQLDELPKLVKSTMLDPFFPGKTLAAVDENDHLSLRQVNYAHFLKEQPFTAAGMILLSLLSGWGLVLAFLRGDFARRILLISLLLMLLVFLGGVIYAGSMDSGRPAVASKHVYWPFLLVLLLVGTGLGETAFCAPLGKGVSAAGLIVLLWCVVSGYESVHNLRMINRCIARDDAMTLRLIRQTNEFVKKHSRDPGFSFLFDLENSDPIPCPVNSGIPVTTILFRQHEEPRPSWMLTWKDTGLTATECDEDCPEKPFLLERRGDWNKYRYKDEYWALHRLNRPMTGNETPSETCIRAVTREELEDKLPR